MVTNGVQQTVSICIRVTLRDETNKDAFWMGSFAEQIHDGCRALLVPVGYHRHKNLHVALGPPSRLRSNRNYIQVGTLGGRAESEAVQTIRN